jgi:hypothetical protein
MTFEFKAAVSAGGQIGLPPEIAGQIPAGTELQIVLRWDSTVDTDSYRALGRKLREAAYQEDSVYDSFA